MRYPALLSERRPIISEVLPESFWSTNFWLYWQTMFAFQRYSSALEMKRYLCRYVHHIDGLPDFSALRFTKYNQYESLILPLVKYLESHGVRIEYGMDVKNVVVVHEDGKIIAKQIVYVRNGRSRPLTLSRMILYSLQTAPAPTAPATAIRRMRPTFQSSKTERAKHGICGRR